MKVFLVVSLLLFSFVISAQDKNSLELIQGPAGLTLPQAVKQSPYTLITFWASWCEDCKAEMPDLVRFVEANKAKIQAITINIDSKKERITKTMKKLDLKLTTYWNEDKKFLTRQGFTGVPANVLLNKDGKVLLKMTRLDLKQVQEQISK